MKRRILCCACLLAVLCLAVPARAAETLTPVGRAVGIRIQETGVTVTGFSERGGARAAGLREGDRILKVGGAEISSASEIAAHLTAEPVQVTVLRDGREAEFLVTPEETADGRILGVRVRDSIAGIGTVTYYDRESGKYGALGHGVAAGGSLAEVKDGEVRTAEVSGAEKGTKGRAGRLLGNFEGSVPLGNVEKNTASGIFGTMTPGLSFGAPCPVAARGEVKTGDAEILSCVSGSEPQAYAAKILKIDPGAAERNLLLQVTDERLLAQTGGIVQGMSGSPILQDGRLVGAVTHVLISDPAKGYGVFLDNMLAAA